MLDRIEKLIGPDDAGTVISLLVSVGLAVMTAVNWAIFWVDLQ